MSPRHTASNVTWKSLSARVREYLPWVLLFFLLAIAIQWGNQVYVSGFGFHPDEPAHYVTGLMVYKYLTAGLGTNPMTFAERFYAHYPAVAFGHWPPLFYVIQAGWSLIFGPSHGSVLVLLALLTAITASLLYRAIAANVGWPYGLAYALLFITTPIVQQHTGSVMAEVPLTLFTFIATLTCASLVLGPTNERALGFAFSVASAILTKGDGWALLVLPPAVLFINRSFRLLVQPRLAVPILAVLGCCLPVTLVTLKMTRDGWDQPMPSMGFFIHAIPVLAGFHIAILGILPSVLAGVGIAVKVVQPLWARRRVETVWACQFALIAIVAIFHAVAPTSLEARKIFMSIPSLLMLAAAGLEWIVTALPVPGLPPRVRLACAFLAVTLVAFEYTRYAGFGEHPNMGIVARNVIARKSLDRSALLVASEDRDEREELSFVAELAEHENANYGHAVIRAGKFLADSSWLGSDYKLRFADPASANEALRAIPISAIVLYRNGRPIATPHSRQIEQVIGANPALWGREACDGAAGIQLYCYRRQSTEKVKLPAVNLRRKLDHTIVAEF